MINTGLKPIKPYSNRIKKDSPYEIDYGVIKNRVENDEWIPWQKYNPQTKVARATFSGLPLVMHNVPTGIATFNALPMMFEEWWHVARARATFSALPLTKWYAYTPSFFIRDENSIILKELSFESLYPGRKSEIQKLTVINNLEHEMNMTLTPGASFNQMGDGLDTYLSHYLSSDGVNYSTAPLELVIPSLGELNFYTYWQPPGMAEIGIKEWLLDLSLEGVPSLEGWSYVSWFSVTGTGGAINQPYTLDEPVKVDYIHGLMEYDFKDIRFALEDHTVLKYDLITKVDGDHAWFVVQLPEVPASPNTVTVYVYCGKPDAEDESDETINQLHNTFIGTELNTDIWNLTPSGSLFFEVNNCLDVMDIIAYSGITYITGLPTDRGNRLKHGGWKPKQQFNIEFQLRFIRCPNLAGICIGQVFTGLIREDETAIILAGWEDRSGSGTKTLSFFNTEGVWTNVAEGWNGEGTGCITKNNWVNDDRFNVERDGNNISVYVNDVKIADTVITSEIDKVAVVGGIYGSDWGSWNQIRMSYLCEKEFVGQDLPTPIVGEIDPQWINIYPIPVKADILFQSRELPNNTPQQRFTAKIGGVLHQ